MKMVVLAAGHGRRLGGPEPLAPVGPAGEALIDCTAEQVARTGYSGIVVVVRQEVREEVAARARRRWPSGLEVEIVAQGPGAGAVPALLSARPEIEGPFAVASADDLFEDWALTAIAAHLRNDPRSQVLVGYRLANTVLTAQPSCRGLCVVDEDGYLEDLVEHHVVLRPDGAFDAVPALPDASARGGAAPGGVLLGSEPVSMSLWGFQPRLLDVLEAALERHLAPPAADAGRPGRRELGLPEVLGRLVRARRERVLVIETAGRCVRLAGGEDEALVLAALGAHPWRVPGAVPAAGEQAGGARSCPGALLLPPAGLASR